MTPTVDLFRKYPAGTTGTVTVYLPVAIVDGEEGGVTPQLMRQATLVQDTEQGIARVDITGVPSTLYPQNVGRSYVIWQENLILHGQTSTTQYKYETPVAEEDDDSNLLPKNVDDPTNPLRPLWAGSTQYGLGGVRILGTGLMGSVYLGDLLLELRSNSGLTYVGVANAVDDETIALRTAPEGIGTGYGSYIILSPYTLQCEIRQVVSMDGPTMTLAGALKQVHALDSVVMFTDTPIWHVNLFGARPDSDLDDSDSWAAAIADVPASGGTIMRSPGVYTTTFTMAQGGLHYVGAGQSSVGSDRPNYLKPADTAQPLITFGNGVDQIRDMTLDDETLEGGNSGEIGLYVSGGTYLAEINNLNVTNFTDHSIKIGDLAQAKLISKVLFGGTTLVQPSNTADVIGIGLYGGLGSNYTTAIRFMDLQYQGVANGWGIVCDGAPNNYMAGYVQLRTGHGMDFRRSVGHSFPHIYADSCAIDCTDADAVTVNLLADFPLLPSYLSGTFKLVGSVVAGDHTYGYTGNGALNNPLFIQPYVLAALRLADVTNPEFQSAPNILASGKDLQFNSFTSGKISARPGNSDVFATIFWPQLGPVLPSFTTTTMPVADKAPGALVQVSNQGGGAPISYSTPRMYTLVESGSPTSGSFNVTIAVNDDDPFTTPDLDFDVTAAEMQTALLALDNVGTANLTVKRSGTTTNFTWTITPTSILIGDDIEISITNNLLGGTAPAIAVSNTPGAWEQIASRSRDNGFLIGQGFGSALSASVSSRAYFPGFTTDTTNAIYAGRNDAAYTQNAIRAMSGAGYGVYSESISGVGLIAKSQANLAAQFLGQDSSNSSSVGIVNFLHRCASGVVPAAGIGSLISMYASTLLAGAEHIDDLMFRIDASHDVIDNASYTSIVKLMVADHLKARTAIAIRANGTLSEIGFHGVVPVTQRTLAALATSTSDIVARFNELVQCIVDTGLLKLTTGGTPAPILGSTGHEALGSPTADTPAEPQDMLPDPDDLPQDANEFDNAPDAGGGADTGEPEDETYDDPSIQQ